MWRVGKNSSDVDKTALLSPLSNLADSWKTFSVSNIKLWYFFSGQADWGLPPKVEAGCSFSWCLCCWRRLRCPPVRGVSRKIVSTAGERAIWKPVSEMKRPALTSTVPQNELNSVKVNRRQMGWCEILTLLSTKRLLIFPSRWGNIQFDRFEN